MSYWHLICAALIAGIHCLRGAQYFCYLRLGQVAVLPQGTQILYIVFHFDTPFD